MSHHTQLIESVRQQGYRMTPQREMILEAIHGDDGHLTADEIYQKVRAKSPAVNLATIYRTLELLKALRLVTAIDTGEGCVYYELAGEQRHHHLVCKECGYTACITNWPGSRGIIIWCAKSVDTRWNSTVT